MQSAKWDLVRQMSLKNRTKIIHSDLLYTYNTQHYWVNLTVQKMKKKIKENKVNESLVSAHILKDLGSSINPIYYIYLFLQLIIRAQKLHTVLSLQVVGSAALIKHLKYKPYVHGTGKKPALKSSNQQINRHQVESLNSKR